MEVMRMTASLEKEAVTLEHVSLERNMLFGKFLPISASLPRKCRNCRLETLSAYLLQRDIVLVRGCCIHP
jgi:hypothetical protein